MPAPSSPVLPSLPNDAPLGGASRRTAPSPGWYGDPTGRVELRFWTGQEWTHWVWDGKSVSAEQPLGRRLLKESDLAHLEFIDRVFLPEARSLGLVTPGENERLEGLVRRLATEVDTGVAPRSADVPAATSVPVPTFAPPQPQASPPPQASQPPQAWQQPRASRPPETVPPPTWWARWRKAVSSDLAVHGLAYLGVLLFFVGVFGLVVFAFGDVTPGLRPLAELVIALAPFLAGTMLLKRQAITVGRALEVLGGILLPIMVATTFVDGAAFPPDPHGILLVVVLTTLVGLIGAAYARWATRHKDSALRYLVAPMLWLTVAMATLGLGRAVPVGRGVATPSAAQVAAIAAALLGTAVWARSRPQADLAKPALSVAGPGLLVVAVLAVLTWKAEGWPTVPVLSCGVLVLATLELLRRRLPVTLVGLAEPLWWALVWSALVSRVGPAPAGAAAAIGFVLITEVAAAARRPVWAVALPALGATAALAATWADPRWATVALAAAAAWALARRLRPYALPHADVALDWVAAVLPGFALAALAAASDGPTALAAGTVTVLLATLPAVKPVLRRNADDTFWMLWWRSAGALVALTALAIWPSSLSTSQQWLVITSLATLATASLVGPIPAAWRPWVATALFTAAFLTICEVVELTDPTRAGILAAAALALVGEAHRLGKAVEREDRASLGLAGHALGLTAVLVALYGGRGLVVATSGGWGLVVAVGLASAGWTLTAVLDSRDRSPVGQALRQVGGWATWLPAGLAGVGVPLTVALALDAAGVLGFGDPWAMLVPAASAVAYAAATRLRLPDQIGATAAWAGFAAGILATTLTSARPPEIVAFASLVITVAMLRPQRRAPVMTWAGWVALAPLAGLLAAQFWPWFEALPRQGALVMTLVSVGGVLLVGGTAADLRGRPWVPRNVPSRTSTVAPIVIGATELAAGLVLAFTALPREQAGWVSALAAAAVLATAVLSRAGALCGMATILGWTAVVLLDGPQIDANPWIPVVVTLVLLVAAQLFSVVQTDTRGQGTAPTGTGPGNDATGTGNETRTDTDPEVENRARWWVRWDLPLLVAAAPVAITALAVAGRDDRWGSTFIVVGLECLAVTVRLRRIPAVAVPVGVIGTALMLAGSDNAGQGWLSLALLGLALALTALAADTHAGARLASQVGGALAALASWQVAAAWLGWTSQQAVNVTMLGAGVLAVAASLLARSDRIDRSWLLVWGGMAVAVAALVAGYTETIAGVGLADAVPSYPVATGLLLVTAALLAGAGPLGQNRLRSLGLVFGVVAVVEFLHAGQAGSSAQVAVLSVLSAGCAALALFLFVSDRAETWRRPPLTVGVAFAVGALAVAMPAASDQDLILLAPGLAAGALQAAAVGIVLRKTAAQLLSPVLACASWLVFSSEAMGGNPQWITMPLGLAILTVLELWRRDRKQHGGQAAATEIVVLELTGVAFLVGTCLVQTVTEEVTYAALATVLGLAVLGWGVLTRVRRRLAEGAAIVLASLVMLVAVPLVGLLPAWQGAALWVLIAGVGLLALLIASFLEQAKTAVHKGLSQFGEATAGWE